MRSRTSQEGGQDEWPQVTYVDSQDSGSPRRKGFLSAGGGALWVEAASWGVTSGTPSSRPWNSNPLGTLFLQLPPILAEGHFLGLAGSRKAGLSCLLQSSAVRLGEKQQEWLLGVPDFVCDLAQVKNGERGLCFTPGLLYFSAQEKGSKQGVWKQGGWKGSCGQQERTACAGQKSRCWKNLRGSLRDQTRVVDALSPDPSEG